MPITAQSIIRRATDILQDQTSVRWPVGELVRYLNDAQRSIVKQRPDAMNTTATMTLAVGARQDLDNGVLPLPPAKLIEITRNMGTSSSRGAITKVDRGILDRQTPGWYTIAPANSVLHYMFDPRDPKTFYVYPPATAAAQLEVMYSAYPVDIAEPADGSTWVNVTGNLSVPDIHADDALDLLLARAYSKDSEFAGNAQLAASYFQKAAGSLAAEIAATVAVGPKS
jgi:hypothetical protein